MILSAIVWVPLAHAATSDYRVLIDADNNAATGCFVGAIPGIDQVLTTRVTTTDTDGSVTLTQRQVCSTGVLGAPITISTTPWPAGFNASSGSLLIETRIPYSAFSGGVAPEVMHLYFDGTLGVANQIVTTKPNGDPILYPTAPAGRRHSVHVGDPRMITLDGLATDWGMISPLVEGLASGGTQALRLIKIYAFSNPNDGFIYFRFDANISTNSPFAADDTYSRAHGAGLTVPAPGVLANDGDPNGAPLTASPVGSPARGTVTLNPDGSFTYAPDDPTSNTADSFDYKASNGSKDSNVAHVTIKVSTSTNTAPHANADSYSTTEDVPLVVPPPGVLANDHDDESDPLTVTLGANATHGDVVLQANGGFTYTPDANYFGADSFTYTVSDGHATATATVTIAVTSVNDPPKVTDAAFSIPENSPNGTAVGTVHVTDNDVADSHTFSITAGNTGNAFAINATSGAITVANTTALNFETTPSFTLTVHVVDNGVPNKSDNGTVTITLTDVNDKPVAQPDSYTIGEDGTLTVPAPGVLANDSDQDAGTTLTAVQNVAPLHAASFALNADGSFTYVPAANYNGTDSFSYHAHDGSLDSDVVLVTITITPVNDTPSFTGSGDVSSPEDVAYSATWATAISKGPSDENAQTLTFNVSNDANALFSVQPAIAADGTLTFTPAPNAVGLAHVTVTLSDNGDGANTSAPVNFTINITAVNDAPVLTAGGASPAFTEDGAPVAIDPSISVSDVDDANLESATITITNLLDSGSETLAANTAGTSITAVYSAPTLTLSGSDTLANYQQVLRSITYANSAQDPNTTARSISIVVNDGDVNSNTVTKTMSVTAVNDAPVVTTSGGTTAFVEDSAAVVVDNALTITDVDSTTLTGATVTISNLLDSGAETLAAPTLVGGVTAVYVAPTLTFTGTATLAQYETMLRAVTYNDAANAPNTTARIISFQVNDGAAANNLSNVATKNVSVTPTNDAPVLVAGHTVAYTENGSPVTLEPALTITDPDSATMQSAAVLVSGNAGAGDVLACPACGTTVPGITAIFSSGTLQLSGVDTLANYQTALRSVTYANASDAPSTAQRGIDWFVTDAGGLQSQDDAQNDTLVNVTAVNDAPVVTTSGGTTAFVEDAGPVAVDSGLTVTDVDSTTLTGATVTITNVLDGAAEALAAPSLLGGVTASYNAGVLTLSGTTTLANYQAMLRAVTYDNASDTPATTSRTIAFQVNDGGAVNNLSTVANQTVSVTPTNDAPVVTTTGTTSAFTEDGSPVAVDGGVTISDVDSANLTGATVTITNLLDSGAETLAAPTLLGGVTASYVAPTLTLTGTATLAQYQTMLRAVTYTNSSNDPTTTTRVISFQVNDGGAVNNLSNTATKNVSITASNDASVVTTSGGTSAFVEDSPAVVVDGSVSVTDIDSTTLTGATVTITNLLDGSAESLAAPTLLGGVTASYNAGTLTFSGTTSLANYQTMLRAVTYDNSSNAPSTTARVIAFQVNDGGAVNNLSNVANKSVSVTATNDAPVVTPTGTTTPFTEDGGAVAVDSGVSVSDVDSANLTSATVTITNLLDSGAETLAAPTLLGGVTASYVAPTLTLTGTATVAQYQTMLRAVTYNNSSNNPTTTTRVLNFQVNDGGAVNNLSNVGAKNVSITAVNDAPVVTTTGGSSAFVEDSPAVAVDNGLTITDIDSTNLTGATVTITNLLDGVAESLTATSLVGGVTANYVGGVLTFTGTTSLANYQSMLRAVTYNNTSNTPNVTARVIAFQVNDGGAANNLSNVATKTVSVTATNDAPVVTTTAAITSFTEGAGAVAIDSLVAVTDVDSPTLGSAVITITNLQDAGLETLAAPTLLGGVTASYVAPTLTLTGTATVAQYQTMLQAITYNNSSNAPNTTNRSVSYQVNDGSANSNVATKTVSVTSVNSVPVVTTSAGTSAFVEDAAPVVVDAGVTVTDPDTATLASATVTIANLLDSGAETLAAPTLLGGVTASYVAPTLTLTGTATLAQYQTMLRAVTYNNASNTPNVTVRTINFQVDDGQSTNHQSAVASKSVSVTPSNDAPVVTTSGGTAAFTEDGGAVAVDNGVTVTDVDSGTLASATITITNLLDSGAETLAAPTLLGGATASYVAPTLTITGVTTLSNYQTMLRAVTYNNTSQNPNGTTRTISFTVNDGAANSNTATRGVTVASVNDAPVVTTSGGTSAFVEDSPAIAVDNALTVTDVDSANLTGATVTITNLLDAGAETLAAPTLLAGATASYVAPTLTISGTATLAQYQTMLRAVTYNNSSNTPSTTNRSISFQVNDGAGVNNLSNVASKTVSITPTNDPPVLTVSGSLSYTENQAPAALGVTASVTDVDSTNITSATVTISAGFQSGADVLGFTTQNGITGNYVAPTLTLSGSATLAQYAAALQSVTYQNTSDDPTTAARTVTFQVNDGSANSNTQTSTISVTATNDPPVNNVPTNAQSVNEDTPLTFTGAGNIVSITDPDAQSGNISVEIKTTNGTTTIVTPTGLTFAPPAGNGTADYTISGTLANVNASLATLRFNPTADFPFAAASGTASIQLITTDNGNTPAPAKGDDDTFNITVNQVNDPPTAGSDTFDTIGNTELRVDIGVAGTTPNVVKTSVTTLKGVLGNDSDNPNENNPFTVTSIVGCADMSNCTLASGSIVSMNSNGTFTFKPSPTIPTGAPASDTFQYVITDQPAGGTPQTATGTVTIHIFDKVWYVKEGGTGNGRSDSPLGAFTTLNGAGGAGDVDAAGDYIFVQRNSTNPVNGPIELEANQHLLGEGVGLSIPRALNGNASPVNLVAAGTKPPIASASDAVQIKAAMPVEVRGLDISASGGNDVDLTATGAFSGSPTLTISDNVFTTASAEDVDVNAGATGTLGLTIQNNSWGTGAHGNNGIDIRTTAANTLNLLVANNTGIGVTGTGILIDGSGATVTITDFSSNTITGATGGTGISINNAKFDQTPTGGFQAVSGGTTTIGVTGNGVGGAGLIMTNVTGDLSFNDLDIVADNGTALRATSGATFNSGAGAGFQIAVTSGAGTMTSTNGAAVDLTTVTASLPLGVISSTTSTGTGVNLDTVLGTFSAASGSAISNATGTDFNINAGNANVTYNGTITDTSGRVVAIASSTGGTKQFTGAITNNGGTGISLTNNTGTTMTFNGGVVLSTGSSDAFTATGGGTVSVCDEAACNAAVGGALVNTLTTTTGIALNVANTTIGAGGLEFRSINAGTAASGPASGIILNTTGATAGLTVRANGGTCSSAGTCTGGAIQHTTSHGISLNSTLSPTFDRMFIDTTGGSGVNGQTVTNFTFTNGVISNSGNALGESNIAFNGSGALSGNNISGTLTVTNSTLTNAFDDGIDVTNDAGTISNAVITGNTLTSTTSSATSQNDAIHLIGIGNGTTASSLTKATIDSNTIRNFPGGGGIQVSYGNASVTGPGGSAGTAGNATNIINITNNTVQGQSAAARMNTSAIMIQINGGNSGNRSQGNFNVSNNGTVANPLGNTDGTVILVGNNGYATMTGTISGNRIVANNTVASNGIGGGNGVSVGTSDTPLLTLTVSSNNISATDGNGILLVSRGVTGQANLTITSNTVAAPLSGNREGIRVDAGNAASVDDAVCLDIRSNTSAGSGVATGIGLRKQGTSSTVNDFGIEGMAATATPGVESYVNGNNPAGGGTELISGTSGFVSCNSAP
ncbi:MAG: tandem-95 repeat protein [Acidobacteria bacterium]|nr:tandem-95 repeat protein [Acidobacteriota bacterium]MBV9476727.1 tandem-95 repeat protein [Acidobacteriota bacterium]